ncbi:hypothetical protein XENOCAPTIV_004243, partial [Xenoophorus captivus]
TCSGSKPSPLTVLISLQPITEQTDLCPVCPQCPSQFGSQMRNPWQAHATVSTLPKLPKLYLEAGAALLMARRPADCMALCDEVISTTLDLVPDKVLLEDPEDRCVARSRGVKEEAESGLEWLLWAAAAYLLQGHCYSQLKDWQQAVTFYTRSVLWSLLIVYFITGFPPQVPSLDKEQGIDLCVLQRLKGLSLAGRGVSFAQIDRLREALRDLQLSLQALPGMHTTAINL